MLDIQYASECFSFRKEREFFQQKNPEKKISTKKY